MTEKQVFGEPEQALGQTQDAKDVHVEQVLQQIRAGVRQRQAERAANRSARRQTEERGKHWEQIDERITELQARARIQERPFVSHVPVVGHLIAFIRRTWNNVATRWFVLPMVHQQNAFNQAVVQTFRELVHTQDQLSARLDETNTWLGETNTWLGEIRDHLDTRIDEANQYMEQVEERLISSDQDVTLLARKIAEREYQVRQWERRAAKERVELARHLERLERTLTVLEDKGAVG